MVDAIYLMQGEHFNVKPKGVRQVAGLAEAATNPGIERVFAVHFDAPGNLKTFFHGSFPGYNPPAVTFRAPSQYDSEQKRAIPDESELHPKLLEFIEHKFVPFLQEHKDVYLKHADGGGGRNIARFRLIQGHVVMQTTNSALYSRINAEIVRAKRFVSAVNDAPATVDARDLPENNPSNVKTIILGKLSNPLRILPTILANSIGSSMLDPKTPHQELIAQKTIPHLKLRGKPVEFRLFLQRVNGKYKVTFHYAKIGKTSLASNIGLGGKRSQTRKTLLAVLRQAFPNHSTKQLVKIRSQFVKDAVKNSEKFMNEFPRYQDSVFSLQLGDDPRLHFVITNPILSTLDCVAMITPKGLSPVFMEHHAAGNFGMTENHQSGNLPSSTWRKMMRIQRSNLQRIHQAAVEHLQKEEPHREIVRRMIERFKGNIDKV